MYKRVLKGGGIDDVIFNRDRNFIYIIRRTSVFLLFNVK